MVPKGITGIFDVDKTMDVMSVTNPQEKLGEANLRAVLYKLKLRDDSSLMGEVHQAVAMSPVDVVVGNTEEACKMIEMTNKNVAVFLHHVMPGRNMYEEFIGNLLYATVDPELVADIDNCKWDAKTQTLRTPKDEENDKQKSIEDSAWYNSDYVAQLAKTTGKKRSLWLKKRLPSWTMSIRTKHLMRSLDHVRGLQARQCFRYEEETSRKQWSEVRSKRKKSA